MPTSATSARRLPVSPPCSAAASMCETCREDNPHTHKIPPHSEHTERDGILYRSSTNPLFRCFLPTHGHEEEEDREDAGGEEADESARPAEVVDDEAHVDTCERRADDVAHETREAGRATGRSMRHHVRRVYCSARQK